MGPGSHVLDGGSDPPWEGAILRGKGASHCKVWGHSAVVHAKTAETIEMPFGLSTRVGPENHILDGGPDPPCQAAMFEGLSAVSCARTAEWVYLTFGLWTHVGRRKHKFSYICQVAPMCPHGKAHSHHLVNMIEPSVCGGNVVLCQITLTSCFVITITSHCVGTDDFLPHLLKLQG